MLVGSSCSNVLSHLHRSGLLGVSTVFRSDADLRRVQLNFPGIEKRSRAAYSTTYPDRRKGAADLTGQRVCLVLPLSTKRRRAARHRFGSVWWPQDWRSDAIIRTILYQGPYCQPLGDERWSASTCGAPPLRRVDARNAGVWMHNDGLGRLLCNGTARLIKLHILKDRRTSVQLLRRSQRPFNQFLSLSRWSCAVLDCLGGSFRSTDSFESIAQLVTVPQRSMKDLRPTRVIFFCRFDRLRSQTHIIMTYLIVTSVFLSRSSYL